MSEIIGYIIVNQGGDVINRYYAIDKEAGGNPYWTGNIQKAKIFNTDIKALEIINDPKLNETRMMNDGTTYPNVLIHTALGLCNNKLTGSCSLVVYPLVIGNLINGKTFSGVIQKIKE